MIEKGKRTMKIKCCRTKKNYKINLGKQYLKIDVIGKILS